MLARPECATLQLLADRALTANAGALMAADILLADAKVDTVGNDVAIRIIGTQTAPPKMTVQIAITGTATVQMQGRLHKSAPWADIGEPHVKSCLFHIEPISTLRAVTTGTGPGSSVSVWATWAM